MHDYRTIILLTSCLITTKNHVIKYCEKVYERTGKNLFWSIKNSCEVLNKLKSRGSRASSLSTYDFSTLYTTLPHNLIKDKPVDLIDLFHIVISLSNEARCLARFRVTSRAWGKL